MEMQFKGKETGYIHGVMVAQILKSPSPLSPSTSSTAVSCVGAFDRLCSPFKSLVSDWLEAAAAAGAR